MENQIVLDFTHTFVCNQFVHLLQRLQLHYAHTVDNRKILSRQILLPINIGAKFFNFCESTDVVLRHIVSLLRTGHCHLCKFHLYSHNVVAHTFSVSLFITRQHQKLHDKLLVCLTDFQCLGIIIHIIVAVAQAKAALTPIKDVDVRIFQITHNAHSEECR